jgi:hypothetical protein
MTLARRASGLKLRATLSKILGGRFIQAKERHQGPG